MKSKIIILILLLSITTIIAEDPVSINLIEGENNITITSYFPAVTASELIEEYPEIQSISMQEYGQTLGFVNTFGGIGTNFLIQPDRSYEIYSEENITINLVN